MVHISNQPENEKFTEPGRWVDEDTGAIKYAWPPEGRFADLWTRVIAVTTEVERVHLFDLLRTEVYANSLLAAYEDENEQWHDVDWNVLRQWQENSGD